MNQTFSNKRECKIKSVWIIFFLNQIYTFFLFSIHKGFFGRLPRLSGAAEVTKAVYIPLTKEGIWLLLPLMVDKRLITYIIS